MKRWLRTSAGAVMLVIVWGTVPVMAAAEQDSATWRKATNRVRQADRALVQGDLRRAERLYARALAERPDLPEAHLGLGQVRLRRGEFVAALESFRAAERHYREEADSLFRESLRRFQDAKATAADDHRRVRLLDRNVEMYESVTAEANGRGTRERRVRMNTLREEAQGLRSEARRLDELAPPTPAKEGVPGTVYFFQGNALLHLDRLGEAIAAWEHCARVAPRFAPVHQNLAAAYLSRGRIDDAARSLEAARDLDFPVPDRLAASIRAAAGR